MACKYVKDFDFGTAGKMQGKAYAEGGSVKADLKQDKKMVATAVHKHEKAQHPGEPLTKLKKGGNVSQAQGVQMAKTNAIEKTLAGKKMTPMKKGGKVDEKATGERYPSKMAMEKHERLETPRMQKEEMMQKRVVRGPAMAAGRDPRAALIPSPAMAKGGLYANIHAKRARIEAGSDEKMNKVGSKAAPSAKDFKDAAKTAMMCGGKVSKK